MSLVGSEYKWDILITWKSCRLDRKRSGSDAMIRDYVLDKERVLENKLLSFVSG